MGAYKEYQTKAKEIHEINAGLNYAVVDAGMNVYKAAKRSDGSIDSEKILKNPEKFEGIFTESLSNYMKDRLKIDSKIWDQCSSEHKERLLRGFAISPKIRQKMLMYTAAGKLLTNFDAILDKDEDFKPYLESQSEEIITAQKILQTGLKENKKATVDEVLKALNLTEMIKPESITGLQEIGLLEKLVATKPLAVLESEIAKYNPGLLKKNYQ